MMVKNKFSLLCLIVSLAVVYCQYADESVQEPTGVPEETIDKVNVDLNALFQDVEKSGVVEPPKEYIAFAGAGEVTCPRMQQLSLANDAETQNLAYYAQIGIEAGKKLINSSTGTAPSVRAPTCPFPSIPPCSTSEVYRRADGSCTNLRFPSWGKSKIPFLRYLPVRFQNNVDQPLTRINGFDLPNPRKVSLEICNDNQNYDIARTHINAAFGQFIDHDFTAIDTPAAVSCKCSDTKTDCFNIPTPPEDFLNRYEQQCMTFVRSAAAFTNYQCTVGHREQLNLLTAAIDLSQVYGNDQAKQNELREFVGGRLRATKRANSVKEYLPSEQLGGCRDESLTNPCFKSADARTNINMNLAAMHTIWLREHNRLVKNLALINPRWNDEKLFQEARRINGAQMQNVIYSEWLPVIVGWGNMYKYDLVPSGSNYYNGYNENVNPSVFNEFSTAAFRLHTLVRSSFTQINSNGVIRNYTLQEVTFRPTSAYQDSGLDGMLKGALVDTIQKFDSSLSFGLQNKLFEVPGATSTSTDVSRRFDLAALNINRCRDHGCASYVQWREWCGFGRATSFSDLVDIDPAIQAKLANLYKVVQNIDLFAGAQAERPIPGAVVGPTFGCMISRQFRDFKKGDRFFFENPPPINPKSFSLTQINNLHKVTLSTLLCDNLDGITTIQPQAFISQVVPGNAPISCSQVPKLDLNLWRE